MKLEIIITLCGLTVAGMAAVLGIWMQRDATKPPRFAYALSILILMATFVSMFQTYQDSKQNDKMEAEMARMLQMLDKIATSSDVEMPELNDFVKGEIAAQSRANPKIVERMAQRMADEGEDPAEVLGSYLPAADVEKMQRKGELKVKPPSTKLASTAAPAAAASGEAAPAGADPAADKRSRRKMRLLGFKLGAPPPDKDKAAARAADARNAKTDDKDDRAGAAASATPSASAAASASPSAAASAAAAASASAAPRGLKLPVPGGKVTPPAPPAAVPKAIPKVGAPPKR